MKKLLTLFTLLLCVCSGAWAQLFSQNFNSATAVAYTNGTATAITSSSSNNIVGSTASSQFSYIGITSKASAGFAINSKTGGNSVDASGIFQAYCNATGHKWALYHTSDFAATAPTALKVSMKIYFSALSSGSDYSVSFAVGDEFSDGTSNPDATKVHSGFSLKNNSTATITSYLTTTNIYSTGIQGAWKDVTWVINNTGATLSYTGPDSKSYEVANDKFDLWIGTTRAVTAQTASTGTVDLQNLYIGDPAGKKHEFRLDDVVVTDLTPATHTVTYKINNGSSTADVEHIVAKVEANMFTWDGHTFTGWNTESDASGDAYAVGDAVTDDLTLYAQWAEGTPANITYALNVGTSAGTNILSSATRSDETNIESAGINQEQDGANGSGASDRTTKLAIKTGDNGDTYDSPTNYVLFKYTIKSGKQFTPTDVTIKVANVGSASKDNIKYKAVLSDGVNSISATYIVGSQDGTVETFNITNNSNVVFTGNVELKLWAWTITKKDNGGSAFRMGTPLTISGYVSDIPSTVSGTITEAGWNTFSSSYALDLSNITNGTAYVAASTSGSDVTLTPVEDKIVAAGTGLMINGTAGQTFTINTTSADATFKDDNLLVGLPNGGTVAVAGEGYNYVFGWTVPAEPGFYLIDGDTPTLGANKAYLHTATALAGGKLNIIIDDSTSQEEETDGIKSVQGSRFMVNGEAYNLSGQRVGADYKGLVIINGKKVIRK